MAVSPSSSAQAARKVLADRLREIRIDAGLSAIDLGLRAGWRGHTKVSKIEHADRAPTVADIKAWCKACGAEDQQAALLAVVACRDNVTQRF